MYKNFEIFCSKNLAIPQTTPKTIQEKYKENAKSTPFHCANHDPVKSKDFHKPFSQNKISGL